MKITTKTGDKDDARIEANGTMDELNSAIGILLSYLDKEDERYEPIVNIQKDIMALMSLIATPSDCPKENPTKFPGEGLESLERNIEYMISKLGDNASYFVLPGGNAISARAQFARSLARRAERRIVSLNKQDRVNPSILEYVNRLSDYFFVFALYEAQLSGINPEKYKKLKRN